MLFCFVPFLGGSVAPNPFLKPGSNRKPPPPSPPIATPRPTVRPNIAQEIEFKGYFILQGKAYFSLFNKKVNHSEWISISEKTYEDFMAQEFNMETETLTILYEGQTFDLSLIQSKSGSGLPSLSNGLSSNPGPVSSPAQPKMPRYMPPKPKNTPKIPSWLVNNKSSNSMPRPPSLVLFRGEPHQEPPRLRLLHRLIHLQIDRIINSPPPILPLIYRQPFLNPVAIQNRA